MSHRLYGPSNSVNACHGNNHCVYLSRPFVASFGIMHAVLTLQCTHPIHTQAPNAVLSMQRLFALVGLHEQVLAQHQAC